MLEAQRELNKDLKENKPDGSKSQALLSTKEEEIKTELRLVIRLPTHSTSQSWRFLEKGKVQEIRAGE